MGALTQRQRQITYEYYRRNPDIQLENELHIHLNKLEAWIVRKVCRHAINRKKRKVKKGK